MLASKIRKRLALLLSLTMCVSLLGTAASAVEGNGEGEQHLAGCGYQCTHTEHDDSCGYVAAVEGVPCGHIHDENCGWSEETPDGCAHIHDDTCGYQEATSGSPCTHNCADAGCPWVCVEGCPLNAGTGEEEPDPSAPVGTDVAMIGGVGYATLDEAIANVQESEIIELLTDASIEHTCVINKTVKIVGNGFTVRVVAQSDANGNPSGDGKGSLAITNGGKLIFDNTLVKFNNPNNWIITMGSDTDATGCELSFLNGSEAEFEQGSGGIYSGPYSDVNVNASKLRFTELRYNAFMGSKLGEYINLNVTNGAEFIVDGTTSGNGLNWVKVYVKDSSFTIQNAYNQASVTCSFTFDHANVNINGTERGDFGLNSSKEINILNGSTVKIENLECSGIYFFDFTNDSKYEGTTAADGEQVLYVDSSSSLEITNCGIYWKNGAAERLSQSYTAAISILSGSAVCTFEEGADVKIHDNAVRAFLNRGTVEFGSGTIITNNGSKISVGGAILNDSSEKAGKVTIHSGAVITNNTAKLYGGAIANGIYYNLKTNEVSYWPDSTVVIEDGVQVYNNHAGVAGDDIYNAEAASLTLEPVGTDWVLDDCTHSITGWFHDGLYTGESGESVTTRWFVDLDEGDTDVTKLFYHEYEPAGIAVTAALALKAAHGLVYEVTYDLNGGQTADGSTTVAAQEYPVNAGVTVLANPTRSGYTFQGWTITTDDESVSAPVVTNGTFTMPGANVHLVANWVSSYVPPITPVDPTPTPDPDPEPSEPAEEIPDEDVPQGELPEQPSDPGTQPEAPEETVIGEEEPPLADAPETGDNLALWVTAASVSGLGLIALAVTGRKRKEQGN